MKTTMRIVIALCFSTLSLQAATRPPAAVQSGPYSWTTGTYQYDASGNITAIGAHTFTYDPLNRLATSHVTTPDAVADQTYAYDPFGNMIQVTNAGIATPIPVDTATNHLDSTMATYDDAGDTTQFHPSASVHTYGFTFDPLGSIATEAADGVTMSWFVYTADDERLRIEGATGSAKHWRVRGLGQKVLRDFQLSGTTWSVSRDYVYHGSLLAAITPTKLENFTLDHLGSPRLISDVVGNQIAVHTYLPFGRELGVAANDGEPMKFTGHERDDDPAGGTSPLDYMHARYYPSDIGRFLSMDPAAALQQDQKQPQSWNCYAYVQNRPVVSADPTGRFVPLMVNEGGIFGTAPIGGVGGPAGEPESEADSPESYEPCVDVFAFGSLSATTDTPIRPAGETVGLFGWSSNSGFYFGSIPVAGGLEFGSHQNYVGAFKGFETTSDHPAPQPISLQEFALGPEVPFVAGAGGGAGRYSTRGDFGIFGFVSGGLLGEHGAFGVGFSIRKLLNYIPNPDVWIRNRAYAASYAQNVH